METPTPTTPPVSPVPPEPNTPSTLPGHSYASYISLVGGVGLLLVAALGALFWSGSSIIQRTGDRPFVIAGILPLSGDGASYGVPIQQTAILASEEINAAGGINGHKIHLVWGDGHCDGEIAGQVAQDLIAEHHPQVIIGGACSGEFLGVAPLAQMNKILTISPSATSPDISALGKYVFRTVPPDTAAGKVAAEYAKEKMNATKVAIITEDEVYPQGLRGVFKEQFTTLGGGIVADEVVPLGSSDFKDVVTRIKAVKPDIAYLLPQTPSVGVLMVKELKAQGVPAQILTAEVLLIRDAIEEHSEVLEGVVGIELFFNAEAPKAKQVIDSYTRAFGRAPTYPPDLVGMYDLMYLMKEAFEAGEGDPDKASEYLYDLEGWLGATGALTFDRNGDPAQAFQIQKISSGKLESLEVVSP